MSKRSEREPGSMSLRHFLQLLGDPLFDDIDRQRQALEFLHGFARFFGIVEVRSGTNSYLAGYRFKAMLFTEDVLKLAKSLNRIQVPGGPQEPPSVTHEGAEETPEEDEW